LLEEIGKGCGMGRMGLKEERVEKYLLISEVGKKLFGWVTDG